MASIRTFDDIEETLSVYVPLSSQIIGRDITLGRMRPLMEALGNPQQRLKIVHIAGTSGKTSTAYYIASLLNKAGLKTGLTVSPHVDSVAERIQINLSPLNETEFAKALSEFLEIIKKAGIEPTYFELLVGLAYWYFEKINVDYAVIETGMGGLHDGTNIADNPDKLCLITDIGLDHMHVLGHTVPEIARQKAGIIHANNHVLMNRQPEEIMAVFEDWANNHSAKLTVTNEAAEEFTDSHNFQALPEFQRRNWILAYQAFSYLQKRDKLPELSQESIDASMQAHVPGRMDRVKIGGKTIIMDGAHNEQKTEALVKSFMGLFPDLKVPVLLGLKEGKEFKAVLPKLSSIASELIITEFQSRQDLPVKSITASQLKEAAEQAGFENVIAESDQDKAFEYFLSKINSVGLITGSFYLLGQLRDKHKELKNG